MAHPQAVSNDGQQKVRVIGKIVYVQVGYWAAYFNIWAKREEFYDFRIPVDLHMGKLDPVPTSGQFRCSTPLAS